MNLSKSEERKSQAETESAAYLPIPVSFSKFGLLGVIEPFHFDHHVAGPGFPETLNATDEREVRPTSGEKHSAVANSDRVFAPDDGLVEEFPSFAFQSSSLMTSQRKWHSVNDSPTVQQIWLSKNKSQNTPEWGYQTISKAAVPA